MKKFKSAVALFLAVLMFVSCFATASATTPASETEENNTIEKANTLEIAKEINGVLGTDDDKDYFKFKASKTGLAKLTFKHNVVSGAVGSYFTVTAANKDGVMVGQFASAGTSTTDTADFLVMANADYYIIIEKGIVCDTTLGYKLSVTVDDSIKSETEPNDTADNADTLELTVSGSPKYYYGTAVEGDTDYFKITVPKDGVLNLYLYNDFMPKSAVVAELQTYVEKNDGTQKLTEVTSIAMTASEESKIGPSVCVPAGDYFLKITGEGIGAYRTRVYFRETANTETEINDTAKLADKITAGTTYKATLDDAGDKDYYEFTAAKDNKGFDINFKAVAGGQWKVRLLDSNNEAKSETLEIKATSAGKEAKIETKPLEEGTYYIEVVAGADHCSDIYEISVKEKEKSIVPEPEKGLLDKIVGLNWGQLWDNFSGWLTEINFIGMLWDMVTSVLMGLTLLFSSGK